MTQMVERVYVGRSLQHEVIAECLRLADRALFLPDPGTDLRAMGTADDIIRAAAERLTDGAAFRATKVPSNLFSSVNDFASLSYERTGASGYLAIVPYEEAEDCLLLRFQEPVPLHHSRGMRKLLELTNESTSLLVNHQGALRTRFLWLCPGCREDFRNRSRPVGT